MNQPHISHLFQTVRLNKKTPTVLTLRDGQLVTGKVLKFFPGNKASIQISGHQMVAEIDTPLEANKQYVLQVKKSNPHVELQVVKNEPINHLDEAVKLIMRQLGIKGTKQEQQLITQLFKSHVPIRKDLIHSILALSKHNQPLQLNVLIEMVQRELPLNQHIYNLVNQRLNNPLSFNQTIEQLISQLNNSVITNEKIQLNHYLNVLSGRVTNQSLIHTFVFQMLMEIGKKSDTTFRFFQQLGLIPKQMTYNDWSNEWRNWAKLNPEPISQLNVNSKLPFNITVNDIKESIQRINGQPLSLSNKMTHSLITFIEQIKLLQANRPKIAQLQSTYQKVTPIIYQNAPNQSFFNSLNSAIESNQIDQVRHLLVTREGQQWQQAIESIVNNQFPNSMKNALTFWQGYVNRLNQMHMPNSNFLMQQLKFVLQLSHFENPTSQIADYPSIQTLLNTVNNQASFIHFNDAVTKLLQIFQSLHLSVHETSREWIQFSTHFPKEMFGLNDDLWMDFEGKKNEDDTIHPKQCRVMFYLNLKQLKEIVIDMQIQNGNVTLTIFHHDPKKVQLFTAPLLPTLKEQLKKINYELKSFQTKPIQKDQPNHSIRQFDNYKNVYTEGVDYRV